MKPTLKGRFLFFDVIGLRERSRRALTMWRRSEAGEGKQAFLFLAAFRGFALVVAAALLFSTGYFKILPWPGWILVGIAGIYTLFKLLRPFSKYRKNALNYIDFGFDSSSNCCLNLPQEANLLHSWLAIPGSGG